jgi:hypothetical protein
MTHAECYRAIEKELDRRGAEFTIHGLPGADDPIAFEEYWIEASDGSVKLFPAMAHADNAQELASMIARAIQGHSVQDTRQYMVIVCGEGWTEESLEHLRMTVAIQSNTSLPVVIELLSDFAKGFCA